MSRNTVQVFTVEEVATALAADPVRTFNIVKKKEDKVYQGTKFLMNQFTIGNHMRKDPWFSIRNVPLSAGVADPTNKQDQRTQFDGTRLILETTVSRAGALGQMLLALNARY